MKVLPLKSQLNDLRAEIKRTGEKLVALRADNEFTPPPPIVDKRTQDRLVGAAMTASALGDHSGLVDCAPDGAFVKVGPQPQYGEMDANVELAFRHLEDARMRVGKVIQALDGGESIFG